MLDLAMKPEEAFRAPLNTTKLAPVTATTRRRHQRQRMKHCPHRDPRLTSAGLPGHAAGLSLIVPLLVLEAHQVGVGLGAEVRPDADDVLVGHVYHLLHLWNRQR